MLLEVQFRNPDGGNYSYFYEDRVMRACPKCHKKHYFDIKDWSLPKERQRTMKCPSCHYSPQRTNKEVVVKCDKFYYNGQIVNQRYHRRKQWPYY